MFHFTQLFYKEVSNVHYWTFYTTLMTYKKATLVLRNAIWYWFPDDDHLWTETCRNARCCIVIHV